VCEQRAAEATDAKIKAEWTELAIEWHLMATVNAKDEKIRERIFIAQTCSHGRNPPLTKASLALRRIDSTAWFGWLRQLNVSRPMTSWAVFFQGPGARRLFHLNLSGRAPQLAS
jgi:hypothetical protein